ncbi:hypothetical protein ACLOJK_024567 [Asimina triloba]
MSSTTGAHSLAFRVMRLCRPSFDVDAPLRLDLLDLSTPEDLIRNDAPALAKTNAPNAVHVSSDLTYRDRFLLGNSNDAMGLSGLLVLPQAFGSDIPPPPNFAFSLLDSSLLSLAAIYLGETFCSYISINNSSKFEVRDVVIKKGRNSEEISWGISDLSIKTAAFGGHFVAEIQTERQRILLLDTSKSPVESIRSGGRYDFIVEHDVKELGAHTLVCTALYNDGDGERKYLPQFFKFVVSNPLSVRTKVRTVKPPLLIKAGGGIHNYLYQLRFSSNESSQAKSNVLGKLQITWRTNLGEPGRLQTQHILGSSFLTKFLSLQPITHKEIELRVVEVPSIITLERPFSASIVLLYHLGYLLLSAYWEVGSINSLISRQLKCVHPYLSCTHPAYLLEYLPVDIPAGVKSKHALSVRLNLANQTDRRLGQFEVSLSHGDSFGERSVMINGLRTLVLPQVEAFSSADFNLKISGIAVFDAREKRLYDPLPDIEDLWGLEMPANILKEWAP